MQHRVRRGFDRLQTISCFFANTCNTTGNIEIEWVLTGYNATNKQLFLANAHNTTGNIDFGWVLTGSKQPAISCKRPQHKTQHRVRMGAIYCAHNEKTNCVAGGSSAQDKLCTPWADNCVTRASSVQDKWCTQWADIAQPAQKKSDLGASRRVIWLRLDAEVMVVPRSLALTLPNH